MLKERDCVEEVLFSRECDFRSTPNEDSDAVLSRRYGAVGQATGPEG
jgi:hypothetical protein